MEAALDTGNLASGINFADALVSLTTDMLDELDRDPHRDPEKEAELISTLRVYRNAAFVFRRMVGASGEPKPALEKVCAAMIEQGHDHWRALVGKAPGEGQSTK